MDAEGTASLGICLICICIMSFYLRDRVVLFSRKMPFSECVATAQLCASWLFSFISIMSLPLVDGNYFFCGVSIYACATLYASTKVLIYIFLVERARAVRGVGNNSRLQDRRFLINLVFLSPYAVIGIMLIFHVGFHLDDNETQDCYIGAYRTATVPLILYDTFFCTFLTLQFVAPLRNKKDPRLARIAKRNFYGSLASLVASFCNILLLVLDEKQPAYQCLTACVIDVFLNVVILHLLLAGLKGRLKNYKSSTVPIPNKQYRPGSVLSIHDGFEKLSSNYGMPSRYPITSEELKQQQVGAEKKMRRPSVARTKRVSSITDDGPVAASGGTNGPLTSEDLKQQPMVGVERGLLGRMVSSIDDSRPTAGSSPRSFITTTSALRNSDDKYKTISDEQNLQLGVASALRNSDDKYKTISDEQNLQLGVESGGRGPSTDDDLGGFGTTSGGRKGAKIQPQ